MCLTDAVSRARLSKVRWRERVMASAAGSLGSAAVWGGAFYYQANFDVEIKAGGLCCMELLAVSYKS